jgi:glycosyltransferase involved in cell wall biosynthesis
MKISAVVITKNEERNIRRCLASLQGVAEEVLVLDSFSEDETREICEEFGVRFVEQEWLGFAATKNLGNEMATHPYILSLDADEQLTTELRNSILEAKQNPSGAYSFNRMAFYCGKPIKHCGWYPDRKLRLFPKGKARWEGEFVHEKLVVDEDVKVTHLKGDLLHYSYYTLREHFDRAERYSSLAAQELSRQPMGRLRMKSIFSPIFRFLKMYIFRLGFLDGKHGYDVCRITAREVRLKYRKAMALKEQAS